MKDDKVLEYLIEAYKKAIDYLSSYFDRIYNRFNILVGIDVALAGAYAGVLFANSSPTGSGRILVLSLGLIISILLYVQSAQDRFVVKRWHERVNEIRGLIEKQLKIKPDEIPAPFYPLDDTERRIDGTERRRKNYIVEGVTSWRWNFISLSRIPAITSLVFIIFWIVAFFIKK